jgi:plastocyanin
VSHTITADNGSWDSGSLGKGQSFSQVFTQAGTFTYHCAVHPSMKGTVVVTQ